jgi:hypothetical protein
MAPKIATMFRHFRWLYVIVFILGGIADALVRPYMLPVLYEAYVIYSPQDGCEFDYSNTTYLFGSLQAMGDGGRKLACGERIMLSPTMTLTCECPK